MAVIVVVIVIAAGGGDDEEDVAASVMESLFFGAEQGRFPNLADRDELWRRVDG